MSVRVHAVGPSGFGVYDRDSSGQLTPTSGSAELTLAPGFVDIHIHGANGVDFMSASTAEILATCDYLADRGYEAFLPTTVTAPLEATARAVANLPDNPMIWGFHLEGPFISDKFPGAQPPEWIAAAPESSSGWDVVLDAPALRVATVAPEIVGGTNLIRRVAGRGVRVGMGHTAATYAEAAAGFAAGAGHTTHTFNAMRGFHHREAGMAGFALAEPKLACELIYDRIHVAPAAATVLVQAKPADKLIAVSDGTAAGGLPAGSKLSMWGRDGTVSDGAVRLGDGTLAGSAITLLNAFQNLAADFGPEVAIRATSLNPRKLLGVESEPKVWLLFDRDFQLLERRAG